MTTLAGVVQAEIGVRSPWWHRVLISDGCWEFNGAHTTGGYCSARVGGKSANLHRNMYKMVVGLIPDGLYIDHLCGNRGCLNPSHMEPVTNSENLRRGRRPTNQNVAKTHCPRGHEYDYAYKGERGCKECRRDNVARWRAGRES